MKLLNKKSIFSLLALSALTSVAAFAQATAPAEEPKDTDSETVVHSDKEVGCPSEMTLTTLLRRYEVAFEVIQELTIAKGDEVIFLSEEAEERGGASNSVEIDLNEPSDRFKKLVVGRKIWITSIDDKPDSSYTELFSAGDKTVRDVYVDWKVKKTDDTGHRVFELERMLENKLKLRCFEPNAEEASIGDRGFGQSRW